MQGKNYWGRADLNPTATNVTAIGASSTQYTLPLSGGTYVLLAIGNTCYATEGSSPTATVGGKGIVCPEGVPVGPMRINGPKIALIGSSAAGNLYVLHIAEK